MMMAIKSMSARDAQRGGDHTCRVILSEAKDPTLWVVLNEVKDFIMPREVQMRSLARLGTTLRVGCFAALNMTGV
jgi:hypothetical protein